jgi:peroxiredoxin
VKIPVRELIFGAAAAATGIAAWFVFFATSAAPQVMFGTIRGEMLATSELRGKVVLVNFWSTSCDVCMKEMPKLVETYDKYHRQGFETVAVAMSYDPPNYVLDYSDRNKLPFKVALDPTGGIARSFGDVQLTPTTFVIDKRGRIVERYLGEPDFDRLHALLRQKLAEPG